jgi:hypothetical protein
MIDSLREGVASSFSTCLLALRRRQQIATPLWNDNLSVMVDPSDLSLKLFAEYTRERRLADKWLFLPSQGEARCHSDQGVTTIIIVGGQI